MGKQSFIIPGRLPGLNDYTKANRTNKYAGAKMKKEAEELINLCIIKENLYAIKGKAFLNFYWYEKNTRRDPDNIAFAKKFILDALVGCGVLSTDGWKGVIGYSDYFYVDPEYPRIEIEVEDITCE